MKYLLTPTIAALLLFIGCSSSGTTEHDEDTLVNDTATDETADTAADDAATPTDDTTDTVAPDEAADDILTDDGETPDSDDGFLSGFDTTGKTCVTDIPDGRIVLATANDYQDDTAPWRVWVLVLADDGTLTDTGKYFETDKKLESIGFNANGRLAAVSSWETGFVTLFALVGRTLCIAQTGIVLPNLAESERVIFDQITADPLDPHRFYLTYGNPITTDEYSHYSGGIYTMTVDDTGHAEIATDHPAMHVPTAFTPLPGGMLAVALGGKEFFSDELTAGPDDLAVLDLSGDTPLVLQWYDVWGTPGANGAGPSVKSIGVSADGDYLLIANSSEYAEDPGLIKLLSNDEFADGITELVEFSDAALDSPDYLVLNNAGDTAVVMNGYFKGATLAVTDEAITYVKKETHDLVQPMVKLYRPPFADHVLISSFRSSNDESASITVAEITAAGLVEVSSTPVPLTGTFMIDNLAVQ
ncbi:MAG TPA: hypothetical protein P5077_10745 [bacterium]|nr:hypothetical protein [bacterium]